MKPHRFIGDADGPEAIIVTAEDGTPLVDYIGSSCWRCERQYATIAGAEPCCAVPADIDPNHVIGL